MSYSPLIRIFASTLDAYDACQCDETLVKGSIFIVPSEGIVGLADTWPVAATDEHGELHSARGPEGFTQFGDEALALVKEVVWSSCYSMDPILDDIITS
jgi:hypothetical protein